VLLFLIVVGFAVFFLVRYYGLKAGWWPTLIPGREALPVKLGLWLGLL